MSTEPDQQLALATMIDSALSIDQVVKLDAQIKELMTRVMKAGHHYGTIAGVSASDKPSLFKAGAEKIMSKFRLSSKYLVETRYFGEEGHAQYTVTCQLTHMPTGMFVGEGLGSATTLEYKVSPLKSAKNYNSSLKMARKRAMIDAVMTATSASDFFTQDVGDKDDDKTGDKDEGASDEKPEGYTEKVGRIQNVKLDKGYWGFYLDNKYHWTKEEGLGATLDKLRGVEVLVKSTERHNKEGKPHYRLISIEPIVAEAKLPTEEPDDIPE